MRVLVPPLVEQLVHIDCGIALASAGNDIVLLFRRRHGRQCRRGIVLADVPEAFELEIHRSYIGSQLDIPASHVQYSGEFSLSEAVEICKDLPKRNANGLHPTFYFSARWS